RVKKLTDICKEMSHNIDVQRSTKTSQPLKCRRLKKSISQTLSVIIEKKEKDKKAKEEEEEEEKEKEKKAKEKKDKKKKKENEEKEKKKKAKEMEMQKEKENVKQKEKAKAKKKGKKVEVVSCDVKRQYPFEGFNIEGDGPTKLMSSFSQWINEGLYKHHTKKGNKEDHYLDNFSKLEFDQLDLVVAFPMNKEWFNVLSQPDRCWNNEAQNGYVSDNEDPEMRRTKKKAKIDENVMFTTID
ncbi:hypothetical protein EJD97_015954, partial [Solanum chilense]